MDARTFLRQIDTVIGQGPFSADWRSLEAYSVPPWYRDAKFGIFIHWGLYAVPAFGNEWYPRNMYLRGTSEFEHHAGHVRRPSEFGYKDFIPQFKAERYDPAQWAELFQQRRGALRRARGGAPRRLCHVRLSASPDGPPPRWDPGATWSATWQPRSGRQWHGLRPVQPPGGALVVHERRPRVRFRRPGSRFADFYGPARPQEEQPDAAHLEDWLCRCCELVDKYQPQLVWFDWWIEQPAFAPYLQRFAAYYYNRGG